MMQMYFEDFAIGSTYTTESRTLTQRDITAYSLLSGDENPLHTDEDYARTTPYGSTIAHGPLVMAAALGLMNRLGHTDGTSLGLLGIEGWRFRLPVRAEETLVVNIEVVGKRLTRDRSRGVLERRVSIFDSRGQLVQEGTVVTLVRARGSSSSAESSPVEPGETEERGDAT